MQLFGRGRPRPKRQAIALDVGTEFVKALIFEVNDGTGTIIGAGRQRQRLSDMQGGAVTDLHGVIKNASKALERAAEQAGNLPEHVIIGIAGELVKGATTVTDYVRPKPDLRISLPELREIIERVQRKALEKARALLAWETGYAEVDVKLVNSAIVDVRIDGYRVTNPIGFQGRNIQVGIYNAFAPLVHLGPIQSIADELGFDLLAVAAEPYAVARSLGGEEATDFSAIFIDIGGGTTDIAVVRAGGLEGTKMFALGGRSFTRHIAQECSISFEQAEEKKLKYALGKLGPGETKQVEQQLESDIEVWLSGVELTLQEFAHSARLDSDVLPSRIMLCGGGSLLPDISAILKTKEWAKRLPFARVPSVHFIQPKDVINLSDETKELRNPQDITPMALANLALDLMGSEEPMAAVLRRVTGSLRQ